MIEYDRRVIHEYAQRLYSQARTVAVLSTLLSGGAGGALAFAIIEGTGMVGTQALAAFAIGAVVGGLIGLLIGIELGFHTKVKAQLALCQAKIEENTASEKTGIQ